MLAEANKSGKDDQIQAYNTSKNLFEIASKNGDYLVRGADGGCSFEIPILPDMYG